MSDKSKFSVEINLDYSTRVVCNDMQAIPLRHHCYLMIRGTFLALHTA